ncbi:hypothetical protein B9Z55_028073 [Caenorhabditis nigoni]|uniref:ZP domain-containing protein n=1 Tax=Caenorhabditis nigoni TaxID=1611254 RepID=A0A2G5SDI7_9PELO|nr:hypothetical protein B9Z55_028073 [Caenorhabditis nigoni]
MKRNYVLAAFLMLSLSNFGASIPLECFTGFEGAISIEKGFDFCYMNLDFASREVMYSGLNGSAHPFNTTTEIALTAGPCFIEYHKDNVFTYCYCKFNRCNVPQKPIRHDRYMARMLLVDKDHPDY